MNNPLKARPLPKAISFAEGKGLFFYPRRSTQAGGNPVKLQIEEPTKRKSRKRNEKIEKIVLKNVVSLRVSDREKRVLEKITQSTSMSVSEVVREAIEFWLSRRQGQRLCRES
ncbi:MAG TPA: hypothetical protein DDY22_15770 [Geobacter sp.]|nr:hypothetical protein [Geobacter sp.]